MLTSACFLFKPEYTENHFELILYQGRHESQSRQGLVLFRFGEKENISMLVKWPLHPCLPKIYPIWCDKYEAGHNLQVEIGQRVNLC